MALEQLVTSMHFADSLPFDDDRGVVVRFSVVIAVVLVAVAILLWTCFGCESDKDVDPVPYTCLYIDSTWRDPIAAIAWYCQISMKSKAKEQRDAILTEVRELCHSATTPQHPVLVSASMKTSLDLFFRVQKYPPGSEVIVTAINALDTIQVLIHHGLHVMPLDVSRDKLSPDVEVLRLLINENTVAILVSHLYGRLCDLTEVADIAHENGIHLLEDCSQACTSPVHSANPESDLTFFSFDVVHPCTAYGGAITKIKDKYLLSKMKELQDSYPLGSEKKYTRKVFKSTTAAIALNNPRITHVVLWVTKLFKVDLKQEIDRFLTASPSAGLLRQLREQPSTSLLYMLSRRLKQFNPTDFDRSREVGDYVSERLPNVAGQIGMKALSRSYWLYPILVDDPVEVISRLNNLGIDAARRTAQIELISPPTSDTSPLKESPLLVGIDNSRSPPTMATFIMDHLVYLPVHKRVSKHHLDQICLAVEIVLNKLEILRRYRIRQMKKSENQVDQKELTYEGRHSGPYGPLAPRREPNRRRAVAFNPGVTMVSQAAGSNSGASQTTS